MEIGLDYMQMRQRAQRVGVLWTGRALLLAGILVALGGIAYYGQLYWTRASLGQYAAALDQAAPLADTAERQPDNGRVITPYALGESAYARRAAELGYALMSNDAAWPIGTQEPARRLTVADLGINARTRDLGIIGESAIGSEAERAGPDYDMVRASPGERGAMWFFGPYGKGTGSFVGLTQAARELESGEGVTIFVSNGADTYLYGATDTQIVPESDLRLNSSGRATVHLAVPVPPGLNDHYLVLSGELVGVK